MSFAIVTDTSANLPSAYTRQHQIPTVPFSYFIGEQPFTCVDTERFDGHRYYDSMRQGTRPTTSQINPQSYVEYLTPLLANGEDVLYVGMSSGISGSFASAEMAAAQLREEYPQHTIRLVDTLGASLGEGLLVMRAVDCRAQGLSLDETAEQLTALRQRICQVFTVDDLMYLHKTGRISNATALVGLVLQIKPLLKGNEQGKIVTYGKIRGRRRAIEALAEKYDALVEQPETQTVGIAHADCPEDAAYLESLLRRHRPPKDFLTVCYEPVTGAHVGPGTLALFFAGGDTVRSK